MALLYRGVKWGQVIARRQVENAMERGRTQSGVRVRYKAARRHPARRTGPAELVVSLEKHRFRGQSIVAPIVPLPGMWNEEYRGRLYCRIFIDAKDGQCLYSSRLYGYDFRRHWIVNSAFRLPTAFIDRTRSFAKLAVAKAAALPRADRHRIAAELERAAQRIRALARPCGGVSRPSPARAPSSAPPSRAGAVAAAAPGSTSRRC